MKKRSNRRRESFDISDGRGDLKSTVKHCWNYDMRFPVFPTRFTDAKRTDGKYLRHINYPNIAVELVLEGEILYIDGETQHLAVPGNVFVIVPHSNVKMVNANPGKTRRKLVVIATGSAPGLICSMLGLDGDKLIVPEDPAYIEQKMREIGEIIEKKLCRKTASVMFYDLLLSLSLEYNRKKSKLPPEMVRLKKYICSNISRNLCAENLADFAKISESTLRRQVKKFFGCSPLELVNTIRLEQAAMLLKTTGQAVKEIAIACGFHSPLYFGTSFKAAYGVTPSAYRKEVSVPQEVPIKFTSEN